MSDYQPRHDLDPVLQRRRLMTSHGSVVAALICRITGISGWQDNIDVRDVRGSQARADGEDASNAYMGGRTITIQGEGDGSSFANLQSRLRTLAITFAPTTSEVVLKCLTITGINNHAIRVGDQWVRTRILQSSEADRSGPKTHSTNHGKSYTKE